MLDWLDSAFGAAVGAALAAIGTYLVNRVQIEARLVRLETNLENHPPAELADRLRAVELEVGNLAPLGEAFLRRGIQGVEGTFEGGRKP